MREVYIAPEVREKVEETVVHYICQAEKVYGITLPCIPVTLKNIGRCGGKFTRRFTRVGLQEGLVFNSVLLLENLDEYLSQVIPHEVAHYVVHRVHGSRVQAHGYEWKRAMVSLGKNPDTRHTMDTANARKKVKRHVYSCGCGDSKFKLSTVMHNKIRRGSVRICKTCREPISFTGQAAMV